MNVLPDVLHQVGKLLDREVAQEALGEPGQVLLRLRQAQLVNALSPAGVPPGATFVASSTSQELRQTSPGNERTRRSGLPSSLGGEENRALGVRGHRAEVVRLDAITPQTLKSGCESWGARDKADHSNAEGVQLQTGATAMRA